MDKNQSLIPSMIFNVTDPAAIAAAETAKARVQAAYIMAVQKPRNVDQARVKIIEACKRPEFAKLVEYTKPVAGNKINGPSIRFAELALREWGNIDSDIQVIFEDEQIRRIKVRELDLETNTSFSADINIKKTVERRNPVDREIVGERVNSQGQKVYIVLATEDEFANKAGSLISKAIRNEGLRLIPQDIIDEAITVARKTLKDQDAKDPNQAKKTILDSFASLGIKPIELERYLKHSLDIITPAELQDLRSVYRSIKDGESTWQEFIIPKEEAGKPPEKNSYEIKTLPEKSEVKDQSTVAISAHSKIMDEIFETCRSARKLFAEYVRSNVESIPKMSELQQAELKRKWLYSAEKGVNGVRKDESWPLDGTSKSNGFIYCPKDKMRISENLCEFCPEPDAQKCKDEKQFLSECKIFQDTLGKVNFKTVLQNIVQLDDPKQVPPDKRQVILAELNMALDQKNTD